MRRTNFCIFPDSQIPLNSKFLFLKTMTFNDQEPIYPLEGGCACGLIRYRLETRPLIVHCCHCTACQRESGSAFAINLLIESKMVTGLPSTTGKIPASINSSAKQAGPTLVPATGHIVEPELVTVPSESGEGQDLARCPTCRVAVWSRYGGGSLVKFVKGGTLDEAWKVQPDVQIYTRSKRSFFKLDGSVPEFKEFYRRDEVWRAESLERWEKMMRDNGRQ